MINVDEDMLKILGKKAMIDVESNIHDISIRFNSLLKSISKLDNVNI